MNSTELSAVSNEIAEIKKAAFEHGKEVAREEFNKAYDNIERREAQINKLRTNWFKTIQTVQDLFEQHNGHKMATTESDVIKPGSYYDVPLPVAADPEEFFEELLRLMKMGQDFDIIIKAIRANELLESSWNKLLMTMKMVQE